MKSISQRFPSAFVTGGSSGLGLVLAKALRAEGVEVWAGSRDAKRITATGLDLRPVELDLADGDAVDRFLSSPPWDETPTLLVNNAGFGQFASLDQVTPEDLDAQVTSMLTSAMKLSRGFLTSARADSRSGAVINVSSLAVEFPLPFLHGYNAVKGGLSGFSRSLAIEFPGGDDRPFVLDLRPGDFRTGFNDAVSGEKNSEDLAAVWNALEHHLQNGADPKTIWPPIRRTLLRGRSRTLRVGTFFQAKFAPVMARLFPESWVAGVQRRYYGIRKQ